MFDKNTVIYINPNTAAFKIANLLEDYGIEYLFEIDPGVKPEVLREFSPCVIVTHKQAMELNHEGYISYYDQGAWDVL